MKPSPRAIIAPIASLLLVLLLNTCGLETFIQLSPPGYLTKQGDRFLFKKTTDNSEQQFTGFLLYYKFFNAGEAPDFSDIIQFEDLGAKGFRPVHGSGDSENEPPPLIYVQLDDRIPGGSPPDNDEFTLTVDFSGTPDLDSPFPQILGDENPDVDFSEITHTDIRRDVYNGSAYKRFSDDFSAGDADISHLSDNIAGGDPVQLVLYAVSYGYDFSSGDLYSEPVNLGTIQRSFSK